MAEKHALTRHFYKIIWPGSHEKLVLPPSFCEELKEEIKPEQAILRSQRGRTKVDVCENDEGLICFKGGWRDFAHKNCSSFGDIVLFEHTGGFHFNATVFDGTAVEKQFPKGEDLDNHQRHVKREPYLDLGTSHNYPNPHFIITMKAHNGFKGWATVNIPVKFWRSNRSLCEKTSATLRDPRGKSWPVKLAVIKRGCGSHKRMLITRGWYAFYKSNKLKEGDACVFQLQPRTERSTNVMDVQIFRGGLQSITSQK